MKTLGRCLIVVIAVLAFSPRAFSQGGTITGTVTDATTGALPERVQVNFYDSSGNYASHGYTYDTGNYTSEVDLPSGTYYARTYNNSGYMEELHNNILCVRVCEVTDGTPIRVTAGGPYTVVDFALDKGGEISGTVTDAATSGPLGSVNVDVYDTSGFWWDSAYTDASGNYTTGILPAGTYYTRTYNSSGYVDELYNDILCLGYCDVTEGTPITVTAGSTTSGIDFALDEGGMISGTVTDAATSGPLQDISIIIYDSSNSWVTNGDTDVSGSYTAYDALPAGTYYAKTYNSSGYVNELYDDIVCMGYCTSTDGTPFAVIVGSTTSGIDFALDEGGLISGRVTDAVTGRPSITWKWKFMTPAVPMWTTCTRVPLGITRRPPVCRQVHIMQGPIIGLGTWMSSTITFSAWDLARRPTVLQLQ